VLGGLILTGLFFKAIYEYSQVDHSAGAPRSSTPMWRRAARWASPPCPRRRFDGRRRSGLRRLSSKPALGTIEPARHYGDRLVIG